MAGISKAGLSGIGGGAATMTAIARVPKDSAATAFFFLFADPRAGAGGRGSASPAGRSAVTAASSA